MWNANYSPHFISFWVHRLNAFQKALCKYYMVFCFTWFRVAVDSSIILLGNGCVRTFVKTWWGPCMYDNFHIAMIILLRLSARKCICHHIIWNGTFEIAVSTTMKDLVIMIINDIKKRATTECFQDYSNRLLLTFSSFSLQNCTCDHNKYRTEWMAN